MQERMVITDLHKLFMTMDTICNFMSQIKDNDICYNKPNFTTKDYKITQYISYITKRIPPETTLYDFQCYVGKKINKLSIFPKPNKSLSIKKTKWKD